MERDGIEPPHVRDSYASHAIGVGCVRTVCLPFRDSLYHIARVAPPILTDGGAESK